jgi:hypothetical protein
MNSNLISKNISGYFDDLINKPIITPLPKQSTISSFYKNYVEHNLLLIIIIFFIILFLIFKYFTKNSSNEDDIDDKENENENNIEIEKKRDREIEKKRDREIEKGKKLSDRIKRERKFLEKEKSEILSIIDELSEMNYKKSIPLNMQQTKNKEKNLELQNEDSELQNEDSEMQHKNRTDKNQINYNNFEAYTNNDNYSDNYYDINKNKSELINGVYFEPPYN